MRKKLWKYRAPLFNAIGMLYAAKQRVVPRRRSAFQRHWGKALLAGAGAGVGYLMYRYYRPEGDTIIQTPQQ